MCHAIILSPLISNLYLNYLQNGSFHGSFEHIIYIYGLYILETELLCHPFYNVTFEQ